MTKVHVDQVKDMHIIILWPNRWIKTSTERIFQEHEALVLDINKNKIYQKNYLDNIDICIF